MSRARGLGAHRNDEEERERQRAALRAWDEINSLIADSRVNRFENGTDLIGADQDSMVVLKCTSSLLPITRRQDVTVRLPRVRMAPTIRIFSCSQTGLEKRGANSTIRGSSSAGRDSSSAGRVGIRKTPFGEDVFLSFRSLLLLFQKPKMDKVEQVSLPTLNG
jgi:hypothetical protein